MLDERFTPGKSLFVPKYLPPSDNRRSYAEYYLLEKRKKKMQSWQINFMQNMHQVWYQWCADFRVIMQADDITEVAFFNIQIQEQSK